jgi:hypothetical protein
MKFIHHIAFNADDETRKRLASLGIIVKRGFVSFDFDEADPRWPQIVTWIKVHDAFETVYTKFSSEEFARAHWLELVGDWHYGYPQPDEENFGFREATYDLTETCENCDMPLKQKAPFQVKHEPKWGRRSIFQLNWVFDEYFVKPEIWTGIFKPFGVGCRPVINKKGQELKTVVQLVSTSPEVDFETSGLKFEQCKVCGRKKVLPNYRGPFPRLLQEPSGHLVRTRQYFGSGGQAFKGVLVSQNLARKSLVEKVRGVSFKPVAERGSTS